MEGRFGRTEYLFIYDEESATASHLDNAEQKNMEHGAGPQLAQKLYDLKITVLITGNGPGGNAAAVINKIGVKTYIGAGDMTVKEAYEAYQKGGLEMTKN